jgi:hypothetical protein
MAQQPRRSSQRLLRSWLLKSRREPPHHLHRSALVDRHAHQFVLRIAHLPPAVLLPLDDLVSGLRGGCGRVGVSRPPLCRIIVIWYLQLDSVLFVRRLSPPPLHCIQQPPSGVGCTYTCRRVGRKGAGLLHEHGGIRFKAPDPAGKLNGVCPAIHGRLNLKSDGRSEIGASRTVSKWSNSNSCGPPQVPYTVPSYRICAAIYQRDNILKVCSLN